MHNSESVSRVPWLAPKGDLLAPGAGIAFGISTPLLQRAGGNLGAFGSAALLYAGAPLAGALLRRPVGGEAGPRSSDLPPLGWLVALAKKVRLTWKGSSTAPKAARAPAKKRAAAPKTLAAKAPAKKAAVKKAAATAVTRKAPALKAAARAAA